MLASAFIALCFFFRYVYCFIAHFFIISLLSFSDISFFAISRFFIFATIAMMMLSDDILLLIRRLPRFFATRLLRHASADGDAQKRRNMALYAA